MFLPQHKQVFWFPPMNLILYWDHALGDPECESVERKCWPHGTRKYVSENI